MQKERFKSAAFPQHVSYGGLIAGCRNMRLVEGRSGPAFSRSHPLMLQRSDPVWTNGEEAGVVRENCVLRKFNSFPRCSVINILFIFCYEKNQMNVF